MSFFFSQGLPGLFAGFLLLHTFCDFPMQGAYLSRQKCRCGAQSRADWIVALAAHSIIQAGGVWIVSGSLVLAAIELVLHAIIDTAKCEGHYGLVTDQLLHIGCKLLYLAAIAAGWL